MTEMEKVEATMKFFGEKNRESNPKSPFIIKINNEVNEQFKNPEASPISNLSFRFGISTITTPKNQQSIDQRRERTQKYSMDQQSEINNIDHVFDKTEVNSNILSSGEMSPKSRRQQAPQTIKYDLKSDSPSKDKEVMSFFSSTRSLLCQPSATLFNESLSPKENAFLCDIEDSSDSKSSTAIDVNDEKVSVEKNLSNIDGTSKKYTVLSNGSSRMANGFKIYDSISSGSNDSNEIEDDYFELMQMENVDDDDTQMPSDFRSLLCDDVKPLNQIECKTESPKSFDVNKSTILNFPFTIPRFKRVRSQERQCLATISENVTQISNKTGTVVNTFKCPEPPTTNQSKRHKGEKDELLSSMVDPIQPKRPVLRKTLSMNDANTIMEALSRSTDDTDLIGDFSKKFCLPYIDGRHNDLRSISSYTMRQLLHGEFDEFITSYRIIDCRFPYEFEGGHIKGAINLYTQEQIIEELVNKIKIDNGSDKNERHILVFHCEFSSERGPKLSRFLRNHDRMLCPYPTLRYPEMYLLHGGYKEFFENNSDLCEPQSYRTMLDSNFSSEYKHFRAKSKSWTCDGRASNKLSKSRSRLVL